MLRKRKRMVALLCFGALVGASGAAAVARHHDSTSGAHTSLDGTMQAGLYPNGAELRLLLAHALMR
jgi:hypothetical protein